MTEKNIKGANILIVDDHENALKANELSVRMLFDEVGFESHKVSISKATSFLGDGLPSLKQAKYLFKLPFKQKLLKEAASKCDSRVQVANILKIPKKIIASKLYKYNVTIGS